MRTLYFLRHGKSDWYVDYGDDHDRPLADRGRRAADLVGRFLAAQSPPPDHVLTSSAVRARTTAEIAVAAGGLSAAIEVDEALYGASTGEVLDRVRLLDSRFRAVVCVGHQPTWSAITAQMTGGGAMDFPTAALAKIDLDVEDWNEVTFGGGTLAWLVTPKSVAKLLD